MSDLKSDTKGLSLSRAREALHRREELLALLARDVGVTGGQRLGNAVRHVVLEQLRRNAFERGFHGEMAYLARHRDARRRVDGPEILEGARSVVCLASRYTRKDQDSPFATLIARYARGRDYHGFLKKKLRKLARFVESLEPGVKARAISDDAPVLERAWAARSGLGAS